MNNFVVFLLGLGKVAAIAAAVLICMLVTAFVFGLSAAAAFLRFLFRAWIIQGLVGAWIVHSFQERSATIARTNQSLEAKYQRQTAAVRSIHTLIEKRLYASRRYLATLELEPAYIQIEREKYREVVRSWNEDSRIAQVSLLIDFRDVQYGLALDNVYFPAFSEMDYRLRRIRLDVETGKSINHLLAKQITEKLNDLNTVTISLMREALKEIKNTRDQLDKRVDIRLENLDRLSYWRLIQGLFQPYP